MDLDATGFIVHPFLRRRGGRHEVCLVGRLSSGRTFAILRSDVPCHLFVRGSDADRVRLVMRRAGMGGGIEPAGLRTMDGEECLRLRMPDSPSLRRLNETLLLRGVRTYEGDIGPVDRLLMDQAMHGVVRIRGAAVPGRGVDVVFTDPRIEPASGSCALAVLSLDIETDPEATRVHAACIVARGPLERNRVDGCLVVWPPGMPDAGRTGPAGADRCDSEQALLSRLVELIRRADPDVITGWNVTDFDLSVLARRCEALGVPFSIGRTRAPARILDRRRGGAKAIVEGRQVLDALWLARAGGERFEDYRLQTVAEAVLGRGKTLEEHEHTPQALAELYRTDPDELCRYCAADAGLVLDILDSRRLLELTVRRSSLIGATLEQSWTSVASFEFLYGEMLHKRGHVAPTLGVDQPALGRVLGGAIIPPVGGFYVDVLVFDFRSLYPSIMRTFNIDPLAHAQAQPPHQEDIVAPNGARFRRAPGIIPQILERFFASRAQARLEGNSTAAYAYKIIMNSFYGVLGARGCRYATPELAGAITSFGQHILHWTQAYMQGRGFSVVYGDTDSLFVLARGSGPLRYADVVANPPSGEQLSQTLDTAAKLCADANEALGRYVSSTYGVTSHLELEFEKLYGRFLLPPMRGEAHHVPPSAGDSGRSHEDLDQAGEGEQDVGELRGRAKGYAGLRVSPRSASELEIVGMEAVRYDWTPLAQSLQRELLARMFALEPAERIAAHVDELERGVRGGACDDLLVYRKRLRKPFSSYTAALPPHVKAAALLPPEERTGTIRYFQTVEGPQPVGRLTAALDYDHYVRRQINPIVDTVAPVLGLPARDEDQRTRQLELF